MCSRQRKKKKKKKIKKIGSLPQAVLPFIHFQDMCPTLLLPIDCPAQFISNPNQTHLKQPNKVFRITLKLKAGVFD